MNIKTKFRFYLRPTKSNSRKTSLKKKSSPNAFRPNDQYFGDCICSQSLLSLISGRNRKSPFIPFCLSLAILTESSGFGSSISRTNLKSISFSSSPLSLRQFRISLFLVSHLLAQLLAFFPALSTLFTFCHGTYSHFINFLLMILQFCPTAYGIKSNFLPYENL